VKLRDAFISAVAYELAWDGLGAYCAKVVGGEGAYEKRTERMEGWNECMDAMLDAACKIQAKFSGIKDRDALAYLLQEGLLNASESNKYEWWTDCSDTFGYACAEGEPVKEEDFKVLAEIHQIFGFDGVVAWCAAKRGAEPIRQRQTEKYARARAYLTSTASGLSQPALNSDGKK